MFVAKKSRLACAAAPKSPRECLSRVGESGSLIRRMQSISDKPHQVHRFPRIFDLHRRESSAPTHRFNQSFETCGTMFSFVVWTAREKGQNSVRRFFLPHFQHKFSFFCLRAREMLGTCECATAHKLEHYAHNSCFCCGSVNLWLGKKKRLSLLPMRKNLMNSLFGMFWWSMSHRKAPRSIGEKSPSIIMIYVHWHGNWSFELSPLHPSGRARIYHLHVWDLQCRNPSVS